MRFLLEDLQRRNNILDFFRRAGYRFERAMNNERSFARPISRTKFPRFHVYVREEEGGWGVNVHLDQKAPVYEGWGAHAGEYDGALVEEEAERLKGYWA